MEFVNGIYHAGHVELGQPVDWPEGTKVDVKKREPTLGISEDQWPRDREGIESLIRRWDALEPLIFTDDECRDLEVIRKEMGRRSIQKLNRAVGAD